MGASEKKAKAKAAELLKMVRNKETKAKADLAAKNEKINEGKMKKAAAKEADAKKAKAKAKEISHKDGEIGMCNGHQCQSADGKCHGVLPYDKSSKLYLGEDLVHCTTKEPKDRPIGSD